MLSDIFDNLADGGIKHISDGGLPARRIGRGPKEKHIDEPSGLVLVLHDFAGEVVSVNVLAELLMRIRSRGARFVRILVEREAGTAIQALHN